MQAYLPMALEGAELTDLHAACPAFLCGRPSADFARHHKLCLWVTVESKSLKLIKQNVLATCCLCNIKKVCSCAPRKKTSEDC